MSENENEKEVEKIIEFELSFRETDLDKSTENKKEAYEQHDENKQNYFEPVENISIAVFEDGSIDTPSVPEDLKETVENIISDIEGE